MTKGIDFSVLVIYDITNNKRRRKMNKAILGFGIRIQKSAFECCIDIYEYEKLVRRISKIIDQTEDVMKIYRFTDNVEVKSYGKFSEPNEDEYEII